MTTEKLPLPDKDVLLNDIIPQFNTDLILNLNQNINYREYIISKLRFD